MEVGSDFGHNLGGEVDGISATSLEERGLLEVLGEESSGLSEDAADEFEFFSLLFEVTVLLDSLSGGGIDDTLELRTGGVLGGTLADLLLLDGVEGVKLVLELSGFSLGLSDVVVEDLEIVVTLVLE